MGVRGGRGSYRVTGGLLTFLFYGFKHMRACVFKSTRKHCAKTVYAMQQSDGLRMFPACVCVEQQNEACLCVCVCVCVCVCLQAAGATNVEAGGSGAAAHPADVTPQDLMAMEQRRECRRRRRHVLGAQGSELGYSRLSSASHGLQRGAARTPDHAVSRIHYLMHTHLHKRLPCFPLPCLAPPPQW